jgi:hypothetical protein
MTPNTKYRVVSNTGLPMIRGETMEVGSILVFQETNARGLHRFRTDDDSGRFVYLAQSHVDECLVLGVEPAKFTIEPGTEYRSNSYWNDDREPPISLNEILTFHSMGEGGTYMFRAGKLGVLVECTLDQVMERLEVVKMGICPSCSKHRPNAVTVNTFETGSVCPHCGHVEPADEHIESLADIIEPSPSPAVHEPAVGDVYQIAVEDQDIRNRRLERGMYLTVHAVEAGQIKFLDPEGYNTNFDRDVVLKQFMYRPNMINRAGLVVPKELPSPGECPGCRSKPGHVHYPDCPVKNNVDLSNITAQDKAKIIRRDRYLTIEEAAKYDAVRTLVQSEFEPRYRYFTNPECTGVWRADSENDGIDVKYASDTKWHNSAYTSLEDMMKRRSFIECNSMGIPLPRIVARTMGEWLTMYELNEKPHAVGMTLDGVDYVTVEVKNDQAMLADAYNLENFKVVARTSVGMQFTVLRFERRSKDDETQQKMTMSLIRNGMQHKMPISPPNDLSEGRMVLRAVNKMNKDQLLALRSVIEARLASV